MKRPILVAFFFFIVATVSQGAELSVFPEVIRLVGPNSSQQLLVSAGNQDVTRESTFEIEPAGVVKIDDRGFATPVGGGSARVTVNAKGRSKSFEVLVENFGEIPLVSFHNEILPILTRNECNSGGCHAKETGQNGFHLSLFGYEPEKDYRGLLHQSRGRRISLAAPSESLILRKASGDTPHEGGARIGKDGRDYSTILRWIEQGATYGSDDEAQVERIEITPRNRVIQPSGNQQLLVTAHFSDGSTKDVTRAAQFEANHEDMAQVDGAGLVAFAEKPGSTSVMVRFREHVDVFRATIPLGHKTPATPSPVNFIDKHVFEQLKLLGMPASVMSDDAMFLRRVTIDIGGRIPTLEETQEFKASQDPDKRAKKIDALLNSVEYADHFAGKWSGILRNKAQGNLDWVSRETYAFHGWLRQGFLDNKPFDQIVTHTSRATPNPDSPALCSAKFLTIYLQSDPR
ncbi:MAG: DUF1549 domain-containing protein, partial [Verrucomicrobiota bacterium]